MAEPQLALLRGINVVGQHVVPMARLKEIFAALGCTAVRTYINSGNVIYTPPPRRQLRARDVTAAIEQHFHFPVPVVLRSAAEIRAIVAANPFVAPGVPLQTLHVVFLEQAMPEASHALLDAAALEGELFAAGASVLYFHLPNGVGRCKLALVPGKAKFGVMGTMRNWATTLKLAEMMQSR